MSGYALTFGGFLLLGGRSGDLLKRRMIFMVGLGLFALTSLIAGLSVSSGMLIGARIAQGAAGAILALGVLDRARHLRGERSGTRRSILGAIAGSGAAIGVLMGGVPTEYAGWQWCFFVNVLIAIVALFLVPRVVRESRAEGMLRHFDAWGAVTVTASLMLRLACRRRTGSAGPPRRRSACCSPRRS